jgi:hypothetical protein
MMTRQTFCALEADAFFYYVADCDGNAYASFTGVGTTFRAVRFTGNTCATLGAELGCASTTLTPFPVLTGQGYYLAAGSTGFYRGLINASIYCVVAPPNDLCANAMNITDGDNLTVTNVGALKESTYINYADVFFSYTATCTGTATVIFQGLGPALADIDALRYAGVCGSTSYLVDASVDTSGPENVTWSVFAGSTYKLGVGSDDAGWRGNISVMVMKCKFPTLAPSKVPTSPTTKRPSSMPTFVSASVKTSFFGGSFLLLFFVIAA